jgi:hypothetical protein
MGLVSSLCDFEGRTHMGFVYREKLFKSSPSCLP